MRCGLCLATNILQMETTRQNDTIVAISTPPGVGGIAVLRLSGPDALQMALNHLSVDRLEPRRATYCRIGNLDDGIAIYYVAPNCYTGEPTVELSCHGSLYVQQALLQLFVDGGARLATAGEFTLRAFLNGRIDLSQAEAVADLIDAVTPVQHRLAVSQLRGGYAKELETMRRQLVELTSLLELELDFSQEDVEFADRHELRQLLSRLMSHITRLLDSFRMGNALKRGIPVAIVGRPNVGKSSLLNALVGDDRAIVSDVPGTTRDTIEETFTVDGITFRFIDTAGIRQSDDLVENMGIERAKQAARTADIVLYVHDVTRPMSESEGDLNNLCGVLQGKKLLLVCNKTDLQTRGMAMNDNMVAVSAKLGRGVGDLKQAMLDIVRQDMKEDERVMLTNVRHYEALQRVGESLRHVDEGIMARLPADLVAVDLREALYHLGTITGQVTSEDVLSSIFSRFCVGK